MDSFSPGDPSTLPEHVQLFPALQEENKPHIPLSDSYQQILKQLQSFQGDKKCFFPGVKFAGFGVRHKEEVFHYLSKVRHHKMHFLLLERRNRDSSSLQEIRSEHRKRGNIPFSLRAFDGLPIISIQG